MNINSDEVQNIVLIRKHLPTDECWAYLLKHNKVTGLTVEQVLEKYQGFEGKCIALYQTSENDPEFFEKIELFQEEPFQEYEMLCVSENPISHVRDLAVLLGYDIGICEEDRNIYSSIFNEVLFGYYEELVKLQMILNENFLFSDKETAELYVKKHNEMAMEGKGVEEGVEMNIYEIWKFS